jgi:DNA repair protein RecN (Recombination protein N)
MLTALTIQNVVLIEKLQLSLGGGLCALTGETGAGKSILLDALGLALGARADAGLVRHGTDQALVSAVFDIAHHPTIAPIMAELGLEQDDTMILRRVVTVDGKSRAFVNEQPISIAGLRRLGNEMVEIHGQFDTHGLLDPTTHLGLLDAFAGHRDKVQAVRESWRHWHQLEKQRRETLTAIEKARSDEEYLRHAVKELSDLAADPGEESTLAEQRTSLSLREKTIKVLGDCYDDLAADHAQTDQGAMKKILRAHRALERLGETAGMAVQNAFAALDRASTELAEAIAQIDEATRNLDAAPGSLERVEDRLFALRQMARKHQVVADELPNLLETYQNRLTSLDDQSGQLEKLNRACAEHRALWHAAAESLSQSRQTTAIALNDAVMTELEPLKLGRAQFITTITAQTEENWNQDGCDHIRFLVATNPGQPPGPLEKIASGGELSRFMLALKVALRRVAGAPTLIFDEVDAGIGGATADAVGERLARLAETAQILVVTHSPQVAARAHHHWHIFKSDSPNGTTTSITPLDFSERCEEIARMLSGADITPEARAAAARLLDKAA